MRFTSSVQTSSQVSLPFLLTHGKRRRYYHLVTRQEDVGGARCQDPTNSDAASRLVATLERTWTAIQHHHPDLPDVVIITGAGAGRVAGHPGRPPSDHGLQHDHPPRPHRRALRRGAGGAREALTLHRRVVGIIDPDDDSGPENVKVTPPPDDPDQPAKRRTPVYECGCQEPRRLRMSKRAFAAGPITCGVCGEAFEDREDPEKEAPELAA